MTRSLVLSGVPPARAEFFREGDRCRIHLVLEGLEATTRFWQDDGYALGTGPYSEGPGSEASSPTSR